MNKKVSSILAVFPIEATFVKLSPDIT
jgi:hypothetical protein